MLKKIKKFLKDAIEAGWVETTTTINHKTATIIVNGKKIDPKSKEGQKILRDTQKDLIKLNNDMSKTFSQMTKDIAEAFKDFL